MEITMPLSHVLAPVDFSVKCEGAVRYAEALQKRFGSRITVMHVLPPPHYEFGAMEVGGAVLEEIVASRGKQAEEDLKSFMAEELAGADVERLLKEGDPAEEIVSAAHELGAGLIIMPTHGHGLFRRFILGSVTAKVLHDADCPVWTGVHLEAPNVECCHWNRIAVGVDLGPQSERTLMWARRFAAMSGAEMCLVHATPDLEGQAGEYFDPDWRKHMAAAVREEVERLTGRLQLSAPLKVDSGDAARTVCSLAEDWGADLLVIGRGSSTGVIGRLRATAYSIIRQSRCPVVSV